MDGYALYSKAVRDRSCDGQTVKGKRCKNVGGRWHCIDGSPRLLCMMHSDDKTFERIHPTAPDRRHQAARHPGYRMLFGDPLMGMEA